MAVSQNWKKGKNIPKPDLQHETLLEEMQNKESDEK